MILNLRRLCAIIIIVNGFLLTDFLFAELTTLQHFDPAPIFSANDSMLPPNSQFLDLHQARLKNEVPNQKRAFGINISGFIQGASRAKGYNGQTDYGTVVGVPENGFEMGDFRGTMYVMGLFLGANPNNGNTIWANPALNMNSANNITTASIAAFNLPSCLTEIASALALGVPAVSPPTATGTIFNPGTIAGTFQVPSVFSESSLALDTKYFGAFSMPILFRKQGLRLEMNFNFNDYIQLTIQGGFANIKQNYTNTPATQSTTSTTCSVIGQTSPGPYSISNVQTVCPSNVTSGSTPQTISSLYNTLNLQLVATAAPTSNTVATNTFNTYIVNNLDNILDPVCGINQSACSFDKSSAEDIRLTVTLQRSYDPNRFNSDDQEDTWPDMIFTPYVWAGGTFPCAKEIDYSNLLSLPFGNNGHASAGGGVGMTFDFAESVEIGFEGGATYFFAKDEYRPFPTHPLQRVIYPFWTHVNTQPGYNWNFRALLNAYQFLKHVNFWFTYELIEHRKDCFTVCDASKAQYFYPDTLACVSDWRGQFFNAAVVFDLQPGIQASFVWQQPIGPRNAYYPVSIMGSINFMF